MKKDNMQEARELWDSIADDWEIQVGDEGDRNRILNSDPVLWEFAGDVKGLAVLDAGCGTGYLSNKLHEKGANVIAVDFSKEMIKIAKTKYSQIDFRVDSCTTLETIDDESIDMVLSNYVFMDSPNLEGAVKSFYRVLKNEGIAVIVFSHPCFPQGMAKVFGEVDTVEYKWDFSYFEQRKCIDPPWKHFKNQFIWFHRPLSDYWKAFKSSGFDIVEFEEPRIMEDRYHLIENNRDPLNSKMRPYSVAFKLRKRN